MQSDRDESHTARRSICVADGAACGRCGPCWRRRGLVSALADGVLLRVVEYSQQQPLPHARGVVSFQIWSVPCRSTFSSRLGWVRAYNDDPRRHRIIHPRRFGGLYCWLPA